MKTRTRSLLAVALCGALAAPVASAQLVHRNVGARANAQVAPQLPTRAADRAVDRTLDRTRDQVDRLRDRVERQSDRTDVEVTAQANAAVHSEAAQRDAWVRLDVDADGRISLDEAASDDMLSDMFERVDADGDGFVSDAEYRAHLQMHHVVEASETGAEHAAAHSAVAVRATWADLDADGDGRISLAEAEIDAGFVAGFDDLDTDGDGFVTQAEYRAEVKADSTPPR